MPYIAHPTESIGANVDFYAVYTTFDIVPDGDPESVGQIAYNRLVQTVGFVSQPILNGMPYEADLTQEGAEELSGAGYVWKFATEHTKAFALFDEDYEIIDGVHMLKEIFDGITIGDVDLEVGVNIEFKRFESI